MARRRKATRKDTAIDKQDVALPKADETSSLAVEMPFRFLDLYPELRNIIYEMACEDATGYIPRNGKGFLTGHEALVRVNQQIHDEFLPILYLRAPIVKASIENFDFRHIVTFLNTLSDHELNSMRGVKSEPSIILELDMGASPLPKGGDSSGGFGIGDALYLEQWLRRLQHPAKKGTRLNIIYVAIGSYFELVPWLIALRHLKERFEVGRALGALEGMEAAILKALGLQ